MLDTKKLLIEKMYRYMYLIRRTEEKIAELYPTDKIKSPVHLSIGQEAVAVGVCVALNNDDVVCSTCRGHATYLAKGGNLKRMIAELYGKITGCSKGKGGSMHLVDDTCGVVGTTAIMGSNIPIAVGYSLAFKYNRTGRVAVVCFGDGAIDEGAFHESINFAALKKLPIIFICENNEYAIHSHHMDRHLLDNFCERAESYGVATQRIPDNDIFGIYDFVTKSLENMRTNEGGPVFVECKTSRWKEHVGPNDDFNLGYRSYEDIASWVENDQLKKIAAMLMHSKKTQIESDVEKEIEKAFLFAENSPFPEHEQLYEDVSI